MEIYENYILIVKRMTVPMSRCAHSPMTVSYSVHILIILTVSLTVPLSVFDRISAGLSICPPPLPPPSLSACLSLSLCLSVSFCLFRQLSPLIYRSLFLSTLS